jgi:hypothetical protein
MAKRAAEVVLENTSARPANGIAWVALGIAVMSLLLSIAAMSRASRTPTVADNSIQTQNQLQELRQTVDIQKAEQRLEALKTKITAGGYESEEVQKEIGSIRDDLKRGYEHAKDPAKSSWQELDNQLDDLGKGLQDGGADILERLDKALNTLQDAVNR